MLATFSISLASSFSENTLTGSAGFSTSTVSPAKALEQHYTSGISTNLNDQSPVILCTLEGQSMSLNARLSPQSI